ncbi:hypothetical protein OS493_035218 [Desmophyllum pertusum]|uniref:Uncharacterized protein n=1 Tax=Desmophyllum pertusum TaxID=174260 RepID=A0A9W9ZVZ9_9CNID|nr:hypothetical protein OS493_035218 [Desmophyllum pertusum]
MNLLKVAFALVFLCSLSSAALPNIYSCSLKEYYCDVRKCISMFHKDLQKDSTAANCGVQFHITAACIRKVFNGCVKTAVPQSEIGAQLDPFVNEGALCIDGPLQLLGNPKRFVPRTNLTCNSVFNQSAALCGKILLEKFVADRSDASLCGYEYAKAKKCVKDLLSSQCTFSSQDAEVFDFQFDDYNPFCDNNRDPGATGSAQCSGFQPDSTTAIPCNKSDVISVKKLILFFLLAICLVLV